MKKLFILLLLSMSFIAFSQQKDGFTIQKLVKTTPVKNQQGSNACWSFSTTSFIETEILRKQNKEVILSPMYFVYYNYINQAENYVRMHGQTRFAAGGLTFHVMNVLKTYGCVPQDVCSGLPEGIETLNCSDIVSSIGSKIDSIVHLDKIDISWKTAILKNLDKYIGKVPETFKYKNSNYTPLDFSKKICNINPDDYIEITSYNHHPFHEKCVLEVPANWYHGEYYNLPIGELMMVIDSALYNGYSLVWDGDITEYPLVKNNEVDFSVYMIDLPSEQNYADKINQKLRQQTFDNYITTEDHLSHLVGIALDKSGKKYYLLKDSQGTDSPLNGYLLISEAYIKLKTISVLTHKSVLKRVIK
jgi:bleomycin hydrolase